MRGLAPGKERDEELGGDRRERQPEVMVAETEPLIFHDLTATLMLAQQGRLAVSASTRLPTLSVLRQMRTRLLMGDYFGDEDYRRAEDAIKDRIKRIDIEEGFVYVKNEDGLCCHPFC